VLDHASLRMAEHYAEKNLTKAVEIMRQVG